jgi:hypothetical protein
MNALSPCSPPLLIASDFSFATPGGSEVGVCGASQARRVDAIRGERDCERIGERDIRETGRCPTRGANLALMRGSNRARYPAKIKKLEHVERGSDVITHLLSSKTKSSMTKYRSPIFASFLEVNRRWDGYRGSVPMQQAIALFLISN